MTAAEPSPIKPRAPRPEPGPPRAGRWLVLWMALAIGSQGVAWLSGVKPLALAEAVERGAARVESEGIGERREDDIRKDIRLQRASRAFWTALALLGDFAVEPLGLALRALLVTTIFASLAALVGRPPAFERAWAESAAAQGYWALGLAVRAALMVLLHRPDVESSPVLLLPPGTYPAAMVVGLRQLDAFAVLGWFSLARGAWRRGQANLVVAFTVAGLLWATEAIVRLSVILLIEGGMRRSIEIPKG